MFTLKPLELEEGSFYMHLLFKLIKLQDTKIKYI